MPRITACDGHTAITKPIVAMQSKVEQQVVSKGVASPGVLCVVTDALPEDNLLFAQSTAELFLDKLVASARYTRPIVLAANQRAVELHRSFRDAVAVVDVFSDDLTSENGAFANMSEISAKIVEEAEKTQGAARPLVVMSVSALAVTYGWKATLNMLRVAQHTPQISPLVCVCHKDMHAPTEFSRLQDMADVYIEVTPNRGLSSSQQVLGSIHMIRRSHLSGKVTEETEFFGKQHDKLVILGTAAAKSDRSGVEQKDDSVAGADSGVVTIEPVVKHTAKAMQATLITLDEDDPEFDEDEDPDADLDL